MAVKLQAGPRPDPNVSRMLSSGRTEAALGWFGAGLLSSGVGPRPGLTVTPQRPGRSGAHHVAGGTAWLGPYAPGGVPQGPMFGWGVSPPSVWTSGVDMARGPHR